MVYFLGEIKDNIERELKKEIEIKEPNVDAFIEKYKDNVNELIGLDYLISFNGFCEGDKLREFLWKISEQAWNKFESFEGIISPKENKVIIINPLSMDKLKEFIKNRKRELIEQKKDLKSLVLSLENIDHEIQFDEELGIYKGFIVTPEKEEFKIIIAPWYLTSYDKYFGEKTLIMITDQSEYETFIKTVKERPEKLTLFFFEDKAFSVYSSFEEYEYDLISSLVSLAEKAGYKIKTKEFQRGEEKVSPEEMIQEVAGIGKESILDEIFIPTEWSEGSLSSLFAMDFYGPHCILSSHRKSRARKKGSRRSCQGGT